MGVADGATCGPLTSDCEMESDFFHDDDDANVSNAIMDRVLNKQPEAAAAAAAEVEVEEQQQQKREIKREEEKESEKEKKKPRELAV